MTYIDPRGKTLRHLDRIVGWQHGEKPAPVTVEWDLSNRCSLGCQDCHFAHTHSRGPWTAKARRLPMAFDGTGDIADVSLVKCVVKDMKPLGVQSIVWSGGGEPTLHPEWRDVVRWTAAVGLSQGLYTLGGHLEASDGNLLRMLMTFVVVSLDAADAETYADEKGVPLARFNDACDGIRLLAKSQGRAAIGVSFLIHNNNWSDMDRMLALARSLGATYTTFRPAVRFERDWPSRPLYETTYFPKAAIQFERLAAEPDVELDLNRFWDYATWGGHGYAQCCGPRLNTTITPDGRVWICPNRRGVAGSCLGDLRTESFADIWARHPGHYTVDAGCRVMCRLHAVNTVLDALETPRPHEAFI